MDSTPATPQPEGPPPISIKSSPRKLPVKRRTPDSSTSNPTPNFNFVSPKLESTLDENVAADADARPPPFKFHRIWTEPDEIRFLQGLLDCASQRLSFPRDLHVFYDRFSNTMPQPYTKSQLSEKLRRLRKKFRILSSRVARGLNPSLLSPQDRALYELSEKLWSPEFSSTSPFGNNSSDHSNNKEKNKKSESNLVGVKVSFSPTLPILSSHSNQNLNFNELDNADDENDEFDDESQDGDVKMSEVNVENDEEDGFGRQSGGLGGVAAKTVLDVFDQCLKEVRMVLVRQGLFYSETNNSSKPPDFDTRWQQQRIAELDVFARRLRLVLHNSLRGQ